MTHRRSAQRPRAAGVVLASGAGARVGAEINKAYLPLAGRRLVSWSLTAFRRAADIDVLLLVVRPADAELACEVVRTELDDTSIELVCGAPTRAESELRALRHLGERIDDGTIDTVLLHDAARPLVRPALIDDVLHTARACGSAVPAVPAQDVVRVNADGSRVTATLADPLVRTQTPQGFHAASLLAVYERACDVGFLGTDTASCVERFGSLAVRCVPGSEHNFKITYPHDLVVAERVLAAFDHVG